MNGFFLTGDEQVDELMAAGAIWGLAIFGALIAVTIIFCLTLFRPKERDRDTQYPSGRRRAQDSVNDLSPGIVDAPARERPRRGRHLAPEGETGH